MLLPSSCVFRWSNNPKRSEFSSRSGTSNVRLCFHPHFWQVSAQVSFHLCFVTCIPLSTPSGEREVSATWKGSKVAVNFPWHLLLLLGDICICLLFQVHEFDKSARPGYQVPTEIIAVSGDDNNVSACGLTRRGALWVCGEHVPCYRVPQDPCCALYLFVQLSSVFLSAVYNILVILSFIIIL